MIPPEDKKVNSKVKMDAMYCQTDDEVSSSSWNSKFAKQKYHKICLIGQQEKNSADLMSTISLAH